MLRWLCIVALCACSSACKIVHSTAGDAGTSSSVTVGFVSSGTRVSEAGGPWDVVVILNTPTDHPVTVTFEGTDDTAIAGADYTLLGSSVTFLPGQTSQYIQLSINPDGNEEGDESFAIDLIDADGATLAGRRHVITIAASVVTAVRLLAPSEVVFESEGGYVLFALSQPNNISMVVSYTIGGTATSSDHQLVSGSEVIPAGSFEHYMYMGVINDAIQEPDETVIVTLTGVTNGTIAAPSSATYTIVDNDQEPYARFSTSYQSVLEGSTTRQIALVVNLHVPSLQTVTVPFSVDSTSTATLGEDFTIVTASPLTFPPGTTTATITVSIHGDTTLEGTEYADVRLGSPTNASLGGPFVQTVALTNDECLSTGTFAVCPDAPLGGAVTLPAVLDTDTSPYCTSSLIDWAENNQPYSCVVFAPTISVGSTVVRGNRPLILAATDSITINTLLDVSGQRNYASPGVYLGPCQSASLPDIQAGGAGGSFMTTGGNGGNHISPAAPGGIAGPAASQPPATLRGGCMGQPGYGNFTILGHGNGGGAVYLAAGSAITIQPAAIINASGGPGVATVDASAGGCGGGSGGMIMLWAPTIQAASAYLVANGGGGAEGNTSAGGTTSGTAPNPLSPFVSAAGGTGTQGGDGGRGFAQGSPATSGSSANNSNGGGGGGGGAGYITSNQPLTGAVVSPAPQ